MTQLQKFHDMQNSCFMFMKITWSLCKVFRFNCLYICHGRKLNTVRSSGDVACVCRGRGGAGLKQYW